MFAPVTVDVAGGPMGGAARFRNEFYRYLAQTRHGDVKTIGDARRVDPMWLLQRELATLKRGRRVALNNVGFLAPGGERWTLLANALHFLTKAEIADLHPSLRPIATRQASVVRLAARRSDVLIVPCSAMADRVTSVLPRVSDRICVRMHPLTPEIVPLSGEGNTILCPVIFEIYKHMVQRLRDWVAAVDGNFDPTVRLIVTATPGEVPTSLARHPLLEYVGRLPSTELSTIWARSRAVFFPSGLESFGFPLAEARVNGRAVIARETAQNREIAGHALCGFAVGDTDSLRTAIKRALSIAVAPDPDPFDPDNYFDWMLGITQ